MEWQLALQSVVLGHYSWAYFSPSRATLKIINMRIITKYYKDGAVRRIESWKGNRWHGSTTGYDRSGAMCYTFYFNYGKRISEEEYKRIELIEKIANI